jgi:hypothetical protein
MWMRRCARLQLNQEAAEVEERIAMLRRYMEASGYVPTRLEDRLTPEELATFEAIRTRLNVLKKEADALIEQFKTRTAQ